MQTTDDNGDTTEGNFTIRLINLNDPPVFTSPSIVSVPENQTYAIDLNATDADGDTLTYSLLLSGDHTKFHLNTNSGELTFQNAPDYEANGSVANDNSYVANVKVSDGMSDINQTVTIHVTNANETATGAVTISGTAEVGQTLSVSNSLVDPDGIGQISYDWYRDGSVILNGGTLKMGFNTPEDLLLSPDGKYLYLANFGDLK